MRTGWKRAALGIGIAAAGAVAWAGQEPEPEPRRVIEDAGIASAPSYRVPILDPVPGDPETPCCLNPPSEAEVLEKLPEADRPGGHPARVQIEKIGEKVDPPRVYPLAGPCQLIHCHYKCIVSWTEHSTGEFLGDLVGQTAYRNEVVHVDKDYLRRCNAKADQREAPQPAPDLDRRMAEMEKKLDRILNLLEDRKSQFRHGNPR